MTMFPAFFGVSVMLSGVISTPLPLIGVVYVACVLVCTALIEATDPGEVDESFNCCTFPTNLFQFAEVRVPPLEASKVEVSVHTLEIAAYPTYEENTVSEKTAQATIEFFTVWFIFQWLSGTTRFLLKTS